MREYVAGFYFDFDGESVLLIRKNRPAWQKGRFNGVGGHVEDYDATKRAAMVREFREETGIDTKEEDWHQFCVIIGDPNSGKDDDGFAVHFFSATGDCTKAQNITDEEVFSVPIVDVHVDNSIPNLTWLLRMAKSIPFDRAKCFFINETY